MADKFDSIVDELKTTILLIGSMSDIVATTSPPFVVNMFLNNSYVLRQTIVLSDKFGFPLVSKDPLPETSDDWDEYISLFYKVMADALVSLEDILMILLRQNNVIR